MSGVYAYCVVAAGHHPPSGLTGLDGRPVSGRNIGPFTVWVSEQEAAPKVGIEPISQHHEVVRSAVGLTTAIPVRFGAWAPDAARLRERIDRNRAGLESALATLSGRIELGVRVEDGSRRPDHGTDRGSTPPNGKAYLRQLSASYAERARRKGRQESAVRRLRARVDELCHAEHVRYLDAPGLVAVAHLVARDDEARYRREVEAFTQDQGDGRVHLTGPWPPYSFATS